MTYRLVYAMPIAKKTWWYYTLRTDINPHNAIDIASNNFGKVLDNIKIYRKRHPRAFHALPKYVTFYVMRGGQPSVSRTKRVCEFQIPLEGREPKIVTWNL